MATYHFSIKSGRPGSAANHSAYIARTGKHGRAGRSQHVQAQGFGNLPNWCNDDPAVFWKMADQHERVNGAAYRELELSLPSELNLEQQHDLVKDYVSEELGTKPYQYALHCAPAALGPGLQPHAHVMFSDRLPDEHDRPGELHFRRYNANCPALGGCKKDSGGRNRAECRRETQLRREAFAQMTNRHLAKNGFAARVDARSNADRGLPPAGVHLGQAGVRRLLAERQTALD